MLESKKYEVAINPGKVASREDLDFTVSLARKAAASWLLVDGDNFDREYFEAIMQAGRKLLIVDDAFAKRGYASTAVLNPSLWAEEATYRSSVSPEVKILAGADYVLVRSELRRATAANEPGGLAERLLICLGGSDPVNRTTEILEMVGTLESAAGSLKVRVLVGAANPFESSIRNAAAGTGLEVEIECGSFDMAPNLEWADTIICAAGVVSLEALHYRLPMGITTVASNQDLNYAAIGQRSLGVQLGAGADFGGRTTQEAMKGLLFDREMRARLFVATKGVVDGRGAGRVVKFMKGEDRLN